MSLKIDRLQLDIVINNDQARKSLRELEDQSIQLQKQMAKVPKGSEEWEKMNTRLKELKVQHDKVIESIGVQNLTMKELTQRQKELNVIMRNLDPNTEAYKKLAVQLGEVTTRQKELRGGMQQTKFSIGQLADGFNKYFSLVTAGLASLTGVYFSFKQLITGAAKLSDEMADVRKTTGLTAKEMQLLAKELKEIDTRTSRNDLLELARVAGKLGVEGKENVLGFVKAADQINVALAEDLGGNAEEAINQIGKLVDVFKVRDRFGLEEGMMKVGSAINSLGAASTANEGYLVEFSKRIGGVAMQAGITIQQVLGLGATLDQLGQTSELSSTALMGVWVDMFKKPGEYAVIAGMKVEEFTNLLNTDANEAFIKLLSGLNGNNDGLAAMAAKLDALGVDGKRSISVLATLSQNTQLLRDQQSLSNTEFEKGTSLTKEFNIKNETLGATLDKISKKMAGAFISQALVNGLSSLAKAFEVLITNTTKYGVTLDEQKKIVSGVDANLIPLINRYDQLKNRTDLTEQEQSDLKDTIVKIAEVVPSAITEIDKYGNVLGISSEKARVFTEQQKNILKLINAKEISEQENAIKRLNNQIAVRQAKIEMGGLPTEYGGFEVFSNEEITVFIQQIKDFNTELDAHRAILSNLNGEWQEVPGGFVGPTMPVPTTVDPVVPSNEEADKKALKAQEKLLADKKKAQEDYYNDVAKLADDNFKKSLSKEEQELLAIDEKYQALYAKADLAGQDTKALQQQHAEELATKQTEIEERTQQAILELKQKYGIDVTAELMALELAAFDADKSMLLLSEEQYQKTRQGIIDKYNKKEVKETKQKVYTEIELEKMRQDANINLRQAASNLVLGIMKKDSAAYKITASALALIDTYASAVAAYRSMVGIPVVGPGLATKAAIAAILTGLLNVAQINAVQFASGKYDVIGASDGKTYRAGYVPSSKSGFYGEPTLIGGLGLVGEQAPELVFDGMRTRAIMNVPGLIDALMTLPTRQYAAGNYPVASAGSATGVKIQNTSGTNTAMLVLLAEISAKLDNPTRAAIVYSDLDKSIKEVETIKNSVSK